MKKLEIFHIYFIIFVICLFIFLSIRATNEYRWSNWGFGDAQTMLSLRHWKEEGMFTNKFLFIPQGYAKAVQLLDEPQLRHHAHGIYPLVSPRVGPRLRYTHYPSGYLIPFSLLFNIGFDNIFYMRLLSIFFSIGALSIMYILFSKITSASVSFVAALSYGSSSLFMGYADSLANQPIDDLLRFTFMLLVVNFTRTTSLQQRRRLMFSAWIIEFLLSLSSFDSVFFLYFWLIGWDFLNHRGFRWKTYLIYALAPLTAHTLQFLQNAWYLGIKDAVVDISDTFLRKTAPWRSYRCFYVIWSHLILLFKGSYNSVIIIALSISYFIYFRFFKSERDETLPTFGLLSLLLLCGLAFGILMPRITEMPYEGRQIAPFMAILVGGVTCSFLREIRCHAYDNYRRKGWGNFQKRLLLLYVSLTAITLVVFWYTSVFVGHKCGYIIKKDDPDLLLAKKIKSMPTKYEPVIFSLEGFRDFHLQNYVPGYPQISPFDEYYAGCSPILCFTTPQALASDLLYMVNHSSYRFSPILVIGNEDIKEEVFSSLTKKEPLRREAANIFTVMGKYILDITDCLNWDDNKIGVEPHEG